ncbi:hypothetical protein DYU05_06630 [Mucilaginibacter terrenus]|uniref:Uncharacterized protein n=1 Tax=Mucilaginibacter terrenus TaxID=2482727 RepID=A0A3E2NWN5_9SPHI|nr:hypothetical protein [Mucilaginibacter terrenus]RFZ85270.1 hypothetical protein DYU05_06630 [Mucilaginibacter terrenus]
MEKKGKSFEIEKADTGERFRVKPTDNVFTNLVEARNNPQNAEDRSAGQQTNNEQEQSHKIGR